MLVAEDLVRRCGGTLLILDEPTVGLDPQSRNAILESVEALLVEGMAVLYTTHYYMEEGERLCDHIAIMDSGRTQAEGTRSEVMARSATSASSFEPSRPVVGQDVEIPDLRQVVARAVTENGVRSCDSTSVGSPRRRPVARPAATATASRALRTRA